MMPKVEFVHYLPDLIETSEYETDPFGRRVKLRVRIVEQGLEILGDSQQPKKLEKLLDYLCVERVEQMLCG